MQKQIKILLTLLMSLALAVSCADPTTDPNNKNTGTGDGTTGNGTDIEISTGVGNRNYRFLADKKILDLSWQDQRKKDYFHSNWMNIFTNQTLKAAGETVSTRTTDKEATYFENNSAVLGKFVYATNIEFKGTNYIGALYNNPNQISMPWMLLHVDADGKLMMATAGVKSLLQKKIGSLMNMFFIMLL
ncbi:hypothetical protein [Brachyspira pilosicoli]|uniref:hypothetical protein n=1 Tax=Brachyspira pilosicoli TaxID=52584 RepID=UPI001F54C860|nr:hypothetical protein [Brachyspira pilosicoli]